MTVSDAAKTKVREYVKAQLAEAAKPEHWPSRAWPPMSTSTTTPTRRCGPTRAGHPNPRHRRLGSRPVGSPTLRPASLGRPDRDPRPEPCSDAFATR